MFFTVGNPRRLSSIGYESLNFKEARAKVEVAVLDDHPFSPREALLTHGFRIIELGADISSINQISTYPIIVCDVGGVGRKFGSSLEGAYVLTEIRKAYPDKFLMAYTGLTYSLAMTDALTAADKRMEKDAAIDAWVQTLDKGIVEVVNPRNRWIRMRRALLEQGVEIFYILKLEQAFVKSIEYKETKPFFEETKSLGFSKEIKDLLIEFSATALASFVRASLESQ